MVIALSIRKRSVWVWSLSVYVGSFLASRALGPGCALGARVLHGEASTEILQSMILILPHPGYDDNVFPAEYLLEHRRIGSGSLETFRLKNKRIRSEDASVQRAEHDRLQQACLVSHVTVVHRGKIYASSSVDVQG